MKQITLATLEKASSQEVFDQVALHLLTQNKQSLDEKGRCRYRNHNGLKCAAGCLISNEEYSIWMEGTNWYGQQESRRAPRIHARLIQELQYLHDSRKVTDWPSRLIEIADKYNLNTNIVTNFLNTRYDKNKY